MAQQYNENAQLNMARRITSAIKSQSRSPSPSPAPVSASSAASAHIPSPKRNSSNLRNKKNNNLFNVNLSSKKNNNLFNVNLSSNNNKRNTRKQLPPKRNFNANVGNSVNKVDRLLSILTDKLTYLEGTKRYMSTFMLQFRHSESNADLHHKNLEIDEIIQNTITQLQKLLH